MLKAWWCLITKLRHSAVGSMRLPAAAQVRRRLQPIAARPSLLLMDEPFGALDAISRSELQSTFATLRRELSMTTVLVTHDLLEADLLASETIVMRGGAIEQRGTLRTLRESPRTEYVSSLLERGLVTERRREA